MLIFLTSQATSAQVKKASEDLDGYIKFVVDIDKKVMAAGGLRHVEGEQLLRQEGSKQSDLWGGGVDLESKEIDFESMINIRPPTNPSRELLDMKLRDQVKAVVNKLFTEV